MITTMLAAALLMAPIPPVESIERADVRRFVAQYEAAVTPTFNNIDAAYKAFGSDNAFYAGTEEAVRISEKALAAKAACPRTVAALKRLTAPATLSEAEQAGFDKYLTAKLSLYRTRCIEAGALVTYVDDPSKSSSEAALLRAQKQSQRVYRGTWAMVAPAFKRLKMRKPAGW